MKKVISILLAVFMLASLAPAALASVETTASVADASWLSEAFTENGPVNTSIAPGFTSAYLTSMTVAPALRDSETSDYAYKATVTKNEGATGNNYADLRFPITKTNIENKVFKISYDVCFDEFNGGIALTLAATTNNANGTATYPINRSVFVGTDDPKVLTLFNYGDTIINAGEWYHVDHIFNNKTGREDAYITGANDFYKHTGFSYDETAAATISRFSFAMKAAGAFTVDNVSISEYSAYFAGIEPSYASTDDVEFDVVISKPFASALLLCDGQYVTNIAPEEGKDCYSVNVSSDDDKFVGGTREISALITYTDGTTETVKDEIKISGSSENAIIGSSGTAHSMEVEDFNHLGALAAVTGSAPYIKVSTSPVQNNTLWQTNTSTYLIPGPSGNDGDYALSLETVGYLMQIAGHQAKKFATAPITSADGKLVIEYDMYLKSTGTNVGFDPISIKTDNFITNNKILGEIEIPAQTWTHVKMEYDVATSDFSVTAGNKTETVNKSLDLSQGYFRFWLLAGKGFAVDNARTYVLNSDGTESGILLSDEVSYMSTEADTFDKLYTMASEKQEEDTRTYAISSDSTVIKNTQWQPNGATILVYGPSGKDTDFALGVNTSGRLIQYYGLAKPAATKGYFVMDFDVLILSDGVQVNSENIGSGAANFIGGKTVMGLASLETNKWTHVTLKYDVANGVMYVTSNGQTKSKASAFNMEKGYIRFTLKAGTGFAIDNVKVYNEIPDASITKAQYVANGTDADVANNAIPANATALKLTTDSALEVTPSDIELYADGSIVELGAIETSENVITVALPTLKANTDLKVVLKNSIAGLSTDVAQSFVVTDEAGNFIKIEDVVTDNNMARNIIRHSGASSYKAIAASYDGNKLKAVKTADVVVSTAPTATLVNVTVAEADTVKVMLWDSLAGLKPAVKNYEVTIAE